MRELPTRLRGYRVVCHTALVDEPQTSSMRLLMEREYHKLAETLDLRFQAPTWLAFARARQGSE